MNIKELCLDEIELNEYFLEEGISALLHTILFVRAPNAVQPEDHKCARLAPLTYAKCGPQDIDQNVSEAVVMLNKSKAPVGPTIQKGIILLSFYEHREKEALFGWIHSKEKVYFERWKIPIVVDERAFPQKSSSVATDGDDGQMATESVASVERQHMYSHARNQVQQRLLAILEVFLLF